MNQQANNTVLDHIFRHAYGKLVAVLVHKFGPSHIEKVEDAVQDALLKAMQVWGYSETPKNPTAWLYRVASNKLIDLLRRDKRQILQNNSEFLLIRASETQEDSILNNTINDSQLKMIFACCNPSLTSEHQIVLSLKLIGGFGNRELAKALLKQEETVAKTFTRAKRQFKKKVKTLEIPIEMGLASRIEIVLKVIYLLFSEGYRASSGENLIKKDICFEAIRLALLLLESRGTRSAKVHALLALMCFHVSRFGARLDDYDALVDLEHQDRSKYDQELIFLGIHHFKLGLADDELPSSYYLQAAVSYYHCVAASFEETDWAGILNLYDQQLKCQYSPIVALNRIVPISKIHGAKKGLEMLNQYASTPNAIISALYYSIKAELLRELSDGKNSKEALMEAIRLTDNEMERKHLGKKLKSISLH